MEEWELLEGELVEVVAQPDPRPTLLLHGTLTLFTVGLWSPVLAWKMLAWSKTKATVTDRRVISEAGAPTTTLTSRSLSKVADVNFRAGVIQRMFGAGDVILETAGEDGRLVLKNMRRPDELRDRVLAGIASEVPHTSGAGEAEKRCPQCGEIVNKTARVCQFCGHRFAKRRA
jgi:hypothetical protein